jgi:hypothetical protein
VVCVAEEWNRLYRGKSQRQSYASNFDFRGRNSATRIATCYGLDSPGIESRWGQNFPHSSRTALGPTQPPTQWISCYSRRYIRRYEALNTHPHLPLMLKEWYGCTSTLHHWPSRQVTGWASPFTFGFNSNRKLVKICKDEIPLNNMSKFSSHLTENIV